MRFLRHIQIMFLAQRTFCFGEWLLRTEHPAEASSVHPSPGWVEWENQTIFGVSALTIKRVKPGDLMTAELINQMIDEINRLGKAVSTLERRRQHSSATQKPAKQPKKPTAGLRA